MMGKGQAFVNFDGRNAKDIDGVIVSYIWDFGDGSATVEKQVVLYGYSRTGSFVVKLTVTDNCGATAEDTANVSIVGPTPPATVTVTPVPTGTVTLPSTGNAGTPGFCHLVMPGQTLYGIAWNYGIDVTDLAMVNGVSPYYYVLAGQGLFIPTGPIQPGPNVYQILPGDTVESVAYQCGLQPSVLAAANGLTLGQPLTPGGWLNIPLWQW
jgi:LysM repeat protein